MGRRYSRSGGLEVIGVTNQKNTLGVMVLVCMLILLWDWLERMELKKKMGKFDRYSIPTMFLLSFYLLYQSSSKTSLLCLVLGGAIISCIHFTALRARVNRFGVYGLVAAVLFFAVDSSVGLSEMVVKSLGRDMTFTGRTEVWNVLLNIGTNPIIGTGFMSFWDDQNYSSRLPYWVGASAHNGYIDVYLAGGTIGVVLLSLMLLLTGFRINKALQEGSSFAVVRFAVFVVVLVANFSESNFALMTPIGFLFLLTALIYSPRENRAHFPAIAIRRRVRPQSQYRAI